MERKSGEVFGMAGLYDTWTDADGNELRTCAIITTAANELMAPIHNLIGTVVSRLMRRGVSAAPSVGAQAARAA